LIYGGVGCNKTRRARKLRLLTGRIVSGAFGELLRAVYRSLSQFIAVYRSLSQFIAVYRSLSQFIAVYRSLSQFIADVQIATYPCAQW
jgi:ABC-type uncharacterized transport system fused permease/ATPase subunit